MVQKLLNFIYPSKCISCMEISAENEDCLCESCREEIKIIENPCPVCSMPLKKDTACIFCLKTTYFFNKNIALYKYEDVKEIIHHFKYGRKIWMGKVMGRLMAQYLIDNYQEILSEIHCIVPVPIHKKKLKARGFNQSEIIAEEISRVTGGKLKTDAVLRNKNTAPQSLVEYEERSLNVQNAFSAEYTDKKWNVLLVDDIYTTGNTLDSVSCALKSAGYGEIYCATFSISSN